MTANWPIPAVEARSLMTAVRVTPGAICLRSSSHFALVPYSAEVKPVALPPGRVPVSLAALARGQFGRVQDGSAPRPLLRRLLLGLDAHPVLRWAHEPLLDRRP